MLGATDNNDFNLDCDGEALLTVPVKSSPRSALKHSRGPHRDRKCTDVYLDKHQPTRGQSKGLKFISILKSIRALFMCAIAV